jgi:hypothetical protein
MQNDVLATGIMSFVMHEMVYFGRSLPWIFIDTLGLFNRYKIQGVSSIRVWVPITFPNIITEQDSYPSGTMGLRQIRTPESFHR